MILKEREIPINILKLEALLRRLPLNNPKRKRVEDDLAKYKAGYNGEKSIEYHLSFLPKEKYFIIHDIRLMDEENRYFQIDTLILSTRFFLIVEIKNILGTLFFESNFNQLIRTIDGKEEAFANPIIQVNRQKQQLETWLKVNRYKPIPILNLVVMSNTNTIIKASENKEEISKVVVRSEMLTKKIEEYELRFQNEIYSSKEIRKISKQIIKQNNYFDQNLLQKYQLNRNELINGVICENCNSNIMIRSKGKWFCSNCSLLSKTAHISALNDFYLLINHSITNQQLRTFLQIPSIYDASRILSSLNVTNTGTTKGKKYSINELFTNY